MKKWYFLLLMICSVCMFTACSDDDDDPVPQIPVSNVSMPSSATIGEEVNILGNGFAETARICAKDALGKETEVTVSQHLSTGVTVVFPAVLTAGDYTVVLKQGGDWELGKITLIAAKPLPITDLSIPESAELGETLVLTGKNFPDNGEYYLQAADGQRTQLTPAEAQQEGSLTLIVPATLTEGSYTLILKVGDDEWKLSELSVSVSGPKRMKSIKITDNLHEITRNFNLHYNTDGKIDSIKMSVENHPLCENWYITYASGSATMQMEGKNLDGNPITSSIVLTLDENNRIEQNVYTNDISEEYTYTWTYDGEYLKSDEYGSIDYFTFTLESYVYKNGNLDTCTMYWDTEMIPDNVSGGFQFYYNGEVKENNGGGVDILSLIMYIFNNENSLLYSRLLGLHGTVSAQLPTEVTGDFNKKFTYEGTNNISKVNVIEHFDYGGGDEEDVTTYVIELGYEGIPE